MAADFEAGLTAEDKHVLAIAPPPRLSLNLFC